MNTKSNLYEIWQDHRIKGKMMNPNTTPRISGTPRDFFIRNTKEDGLIVAVFMTDGKCYIDPHMTRQIKNEQALSLEHRRITKSSKSSKSL